MDKRGYSYDEGSNEAGNGNWMVWVLCSLRSRVSGTFCVNLQRGRTWASYTQVDLSMDQHCVEERVFGWRTDLLAK